MPLKIGLIDVDAHNFPNLPLMKLSAHHKSKGDTVEMFVPIEQYDIIYKSKIFTHTPDTLYQPKADVLFEGGTGYVEPKEYHGSMEKPTTMLNLLPEIESIMPDYSLYPKYKEAYGFLTRGCPRNCAFCIVTQKEGFYSKKVADLSDFRTNQKVIKLLDPNLLACADRENLLIQLARSKAWVDFTQGLDIRLINKDLIGLLNSINTKMIHFAWDNPNEDLTRQFELFTKYSKLNSYRKRAVYILTNYNSTHEQDLERVYKLKELGYNPFIMTYDKQSAPLVTKRLQRWVNNRRVFRSCEKFEDYMCQTAGKGAKLIVKIENVALEQMQGQLSFEEMPEVLTLGSLFDGIGGFILAAKTVGIKSLWASEIEPNCIAITSHHFPDILHLGDITMIDGGKIPPVDIVSFGSPCQDLSISGKRKGLSGERSGLFIEAVRIIKEMRAATNNKQPRYAIWENVPGALSSNEGEDFRIVLEELLNTALIGNWGDDYSKIERITEIGFIKVPKPPKWGNAGSIVGDNGNTPYSISWRILDAQHFGVPQRRKRIFAIADFGGRSSEEILFECEILSGDIEQSAEEKQSDAANASGSLEATDIDSNVIKGLMYEKTFSIVENIIDRNITAGGNGIGIAEDICYTLTTSSPHAVVNCSLYNRNGFGMYKENTITGTLTAHLGQEADDLVVDCGSQGNRIHCNTKNSCTLTSGAGGFGGKTGVYFFDEHYEKSKEDLMTVLNTENLLKTIENIIDKEGIEKLLQQGYELHINGVRRLTPLECERLQGYSDGWTKLEITNNGGKIKEISDNARYKALGNSVAVPCVIFLLERLKSHHFEGS